VSSNYFFTARISSAVCLYHSDPKSSKKRDFEVAKDSPLSPSENRTKGRDRKKRRESIQNDTPFGASSRHRRKKSALGNGTPNVRIQVTSPSGRTMPIGTLASLYGSQGFLRY
jgi:hypothetical protein